MSQKKVYKPKPMINNKCDLIQKLFEEYEIQNALKDYLPGTIKEMMDSDKNDHLSCIVNLRPVVEITGVRASV